MEKKIVYANEARDLLLQGVNQLANAVVTTLGPSGRNVIIEQEVGNPISTKDGVTVAKSIELEDRVANIGAQLVKQASIKTADQAGDGTTTSTLLAREIYEQGMKKIEAGVNSVEVKKGIDLAVKDVVSYLSKQSEQITEETQLKQVATISANNDKEIGEIISAAMENVGREGVITIEESRTGETYLETVEGMQFERGYKSPYFVTDNSSMQAVLKDPYILITDKRLVQIKELLPLLEAVSQKSKPLLIIADDVDGEVLSTLVVNKMRGILSCVAVKAPEFGDRKKAILEDIAVLTGGMVVSSEKGMNLEKFNTSWLGRAKKVTVSRDNTTIVDAQGAEESINTRIEEIKTQIAESAAPYEIEKLQDRLASFIGGVAIVHVGGLTELEMKERKDRVDDALHATKAALEEGISVGGGVALLQASQSIEIPTDSLSKDAIIGYSLILDAIKKPFYQILENAGYYDKTIKSIEETILQDDPEERIGYNPREQKHVNMFEAGIVDPTKVIRLALENAASVAGTMLTTEAIVSNIKEKKESDVDLSSFM